MVNRKESGIIHIGIPLLLIIGAVGVLVFLLVTGRISLPFLKGGKLEVKVAVDYKNPFVKDSQYVNPFDDTKSPFLNLKK